MSLVQIQAGEQKQKQVGIAQLIEYLVANQKVVGLNPISYSNFKTKVMKDKK
jgi:hypothetical protein